jgi:hypothetical protein
MNTGTLVGSLIMAAVLAVLIAFIIQGMLRGWRRRAERQAELIGTRSSPPPKVCTSAARSSRIGTTASRWAISASVTRRS